MAEYTLKVRRYQPESGEGAFWEEFKVDLDPSLSVLDGILQAKDRDDGSLAVRCSCRAAICGSCGMKVNGSSTLACKTQIGEAHEQANRRAGGGTPPPTGADEDYQPTDGSPGTPGRESEGQSISVSPGPSESEDVPQPIVVEPMGNMPVIKDLVTDMESTHWTKIRRVTPWLLPHGDPPE